MLKRLRYLSNETKYQKMENSEDIIIDVATNLKNIGDEVQRAYESRRLGLILLEELDPARRRPDLAIRERLEPAVEIIHQNLGEILRFVHYGVVLCIGFRALMR